VPKTAILKSERAGDEVYVVKDGVAVRRRVRVGEHSADRVQIVAGVKEGEVVLVEGHEKIPNLTEVSVSFLEGE
jgi:HlyD family secretion protein